MNVSLIQLTPELITDLLEQATRKGSTKQYEQWVKEQPSCLSNVHSEYHEDGRHYSIPCHVRRVKFGSGTSRKPSYFAVPLTNAEHATQHGKRGEQGCLKDAGYPMTVEDAKTWFEDKAIDYLIQWLESWLPRGHPGERQWLRRE